LERNVRVFYKLLVNNAIFMPYFAEMAYKRSIVISVTAATSQTIQMPQTGTITGVYFSAVTAAAGSWELSTSSTSQIATGSPDTGVLARMRIGATAGMQNIYLPLGKKVKVLDNLYIHTTGAGNVGELTLFVG
jgi:hypothetical protein